MTYREKLKEVLTPEFYNILLEAHKRSPSREGRLDEPTIYWGNFADYLVSWSRSSEGTDFWFGVHNLCLCDINGWDYSKVNHIDGVQIFK